MKYYSFYKKYFPSLEQKIQQNVNCIFHEDNTPSLSINIEQGLWYCHTCNTGGDIFSFYMKYHKCNFFTAKKEITGDIKTPILSQSEVDEAHEILVKSDNLQKLIFLKRGWTLETIKKYKLGWSNKRISIPIYTEDNELCNIRKYDFLHEQKNKFISVKAHGQVILFPIEALNYDKIVIFSGEPDTIFARQYGINGITFTGGEGTFKKELLPKFKDKIIYIAYDVDKIGKKSAKALAHSLTDIGKEVYIINYPEKLLPKNGDFTDFVFYCVDNEIDFETEWNKIVKTADRIVKTDYDIYVDHEEVNFYDSVKAEFYNKNIKFPAIAIGKNLSPYYAPQEITVSCNFTRGDSCKSCILFISGGEYSIKINNIKSLDLIKCTQVEQLNKIKNIIGIRGCGQFEIKQKTIAIEEIFISPVIDSEKIDQQFITRKCFTIGHDIQLNKTYEFEGQTINNPKTQEATHIFNKQIPEISALNTFELTENKIELLKRYFNPIKNDDISVEKKLYEIARDINSNVLEEIKGRENLIIAYDIVFHSALGFNFLNNKISKGFLELLVIGDTRTGKTKIATKLCQHYKAGEYITLETATIPGLIGGVSTIGKDSIFSWGILPINDGRLVILDEVNGLEIKEIAHLSAIRDNGIAERTIVGSTRKTQSRVRLIWISNPRTTRNISSYTSGVEAIRDLIGRPEDIARFDFAIIVAKQDIPSDRINTLYSKKVPHVYTDELCNDVLLWTWSRKPKNIIFDKDTEQLILDCAMEMGRKYSDVIPLVQDSVQRIKLAKLSVAVACRLFSTEDGINVIVRTCHVEYIYNFLNSIYDSKYFGYNNYSEYQKKTEDILDAKNVKHEIDGLLNPERFIHKMLYTNSITFEDLMDFTGMEREITKNFKTLLVNNNCIRRYKNYYVKMPIFVSYLKRLDAERKEDNA